MGGHVWIMFGGLAAVSGHAKNGKLKLIAVTGKERMSIAPEIPTIHESGYPGFEAVGWFGLIAPAKLPKPILQRLHGETIKAALQAESHKKLKAVGFDIVTNSPGEFHHYMQSEFRKWQQLVKQIQIKSS